MQSSLVGRVAPAKTVRENVESGKHLRASEGTTRYQTGPLCDFWGTRMATPLAEFGA
jgi:hypothetical protein